jgi:(5-formylfuran-3-yl)methyl phosphate synthase
MSELIISVRNLEEALLVANAGAKWIDVKEPTRGSLGAATFVVRDEIAAGLAAWPQLCLSAADGELTDWQASTQLATLANAYQFAKVGLSRCADVSNWQSRWHNWRTQLAEQTQPVLVYYADGDRHGQPTITELQQLIDCEQIQWLLIDTFDKSGPSLCELLNHSELSHLVQQFRQFLPNIVLAGKVRCDQFQQLTQYHPQAIAVRSAVCSASNEPSARTGQLNRLQLQECLQHFDVI